MPGRTYSREFKLAIVRQVASGEQRPAQICREHGTVNLSTFNGNDVSKVGNTACLRAIISRQALCLGR